ncbi:unnamed protein product [Rotaria sordida]|uniref:FMN hydroxy acid dehydrogenase domain-containing protein n=1 Tax=Rotaria sordida TaxID=392033 RepID=A0A815EIL9_9BILA|nr:unnamed protein product [Rotaria sordida]CAF1580762.1 unnamed protein product [Rotaria sordida]
MDVSEISLKTTIFGSIYELPILIATSACHCLAHVDGEVATARAATETQCIFTYNSTFSNMPEEKVLQTLGPKFLHIYLTKPIEILEQIVPQADKKGYPAIFITCDQPHERIRDFVLPLFEEASKNIDPELMKNMSIPNLNIPGIIVKQHFGTGILSPIDAELAIKYGPNVIIVSNHGGRLIDTVPPAIQCLEDVVNAVDGRAEVFVDTGIRSGTDALKALALGARAVLIGRSILYGLACSGQDGVRRVLDILKHELVYDMACCGLTSIDKINKDILYKH